MGFPETFMWGASTAAYQIEGAAYDDGKAASTWDVYSHQPGIIYEGNTADVGCDHYYRYREDVDLMKQIGLKAYRFSFSWARVMPSATGAPNEKGLEFYDRLIDALLENGIEPCPTLFHGDPPYCLHLQGGWLNRSISDHFAEYASVVARRFSDRVKYWFTFNEPQYLIHFGYHVGGGAPSLQHHFSEVLAMSHTVLLAHGKSVQALRASTKQPARIGLVLVGNIFVPATETPADISATSTAMFATTAKTVDTTSWWSEPIYNGRYPDDGVALFGNDMIEYDPADMKTICQPLDFCALNVYSIKNIIRAGENGEPEMVARPLGHPVNASGWDICPEVLYWGTRFFYERYRLPIFITENGMTNVDFIHDDGKVHDPQRIQFTTWYLQNLKRAIEKDSIPVIGYLHWSLLDNFEWTSGFRPRFGLVYVDYPTQRRIPKDSALWYRSVIELNGENL